MHRTRVTGRRGRARRQQHDRAGQPRRLRPRRRDRRQLHERARRGQDDAARAGRARARRRRCASACWRATSKGSMDADRLAWLHVPVTQLNTAGGLRRRVPPGREHGALGAAGAAARRHRPAGDRERRQPGLPGGVPGRRGRAGDGLLGHRGRGQAAQVPADVPHLRPGADQQDRPAAAPGLRRRQAARERRRRPSRRADACWSARRTGEGVDGWRDWLVERTARAGAPA